MTVCKMTRHNYDGTAPHTGETMKMRSGLLTNLLCLCFLMATCVAWAQQTYKYPFQDPALPLEERVNNILSLMTLEEKVAALSTEPSVPRLGIKGSGHVEGLHGLALGGPGAWGRFHDANGNPQNVPIPTTTFPQEVGLGETWDPDVVRQAAAVEGF